MLKGGGHLGQGTHATDRSTVHTDTSNDKEEGLDGGGLDFFEAGYWVTGRPETLADWRGGN